MEFCRTSNEGYQNTAKQDWLPENIVEIEQQKLLLLAENICKNCRYPLLGLRLLIHVIAGIDSDGKINISARQLSKTLDVHYDTVTKCIKDLREIGFLRKEE